jgi:hypothetical protein
MEAVVYFKAFNLEWLRKMYENSGWSVPSQDMKYILPEYKLDVLVLSESAHNNGNVLFVFRKHTQFECWLDMKIPYSGMWHQIVLYMAYLEDIGSRFLSNINT